jgi:mono/diheme cytochrome c family protein
VSRSRRVAFVPGPAEGELPPAAAAGARAAKVALASPPRIAAAGALAALVAAGAALLAAAPAAAQSPRVRVLYVLHCQGCHLADGSGKAGEVPPLADSLGRFLAVAGGRAYLVQVPGSAHAPLTDAELAEVLNWMVRAFGPEDAAARLTPFDAAEVARHRATPLVDVAARRAALLRELGSAAGSVAADPPTTDAAPASER